MITSTKKIGGLIVILFMLTVISLPVLTYSAQNQTAAGVVSGLTYECANGPSGECKFEDLLAAVKNVTDKGTIITLSLSVIVIAWAGFKYMISGDNAGERKKANEMLRKVAIGIVIIIAAWLIVTLITNALIPGTNTFLK